MSKILLLEDTQAGYVDKKGYRLCSDTYIASVLIGGNKWVEDVCKDIGKMDGVKSIDILYTRSGTPDKIILVLYPDYNNSLYKMWVKLDEIRVPNSTYKIDK